ncbi:MAG: DMT family transporter [Methylococcales bacterium]|nr:DMT family transporter [Methylococcales bacterium]
MRVLLAYLGMVLLWATTPLAIKWSVDGFGVLWGVTSRMVIGSLCMILLLLILKKRLPFSRFACLIYAAVALQIYGSMCVVYWAAQFIPSGWISVVSGLTPLVTALFAAIWLNERSLTIGKIFSYLIGVIGLGIMFGSAEKLSANAIFGIVGVLISVVLQALSAIAVKRLNSKMSTLTQVTGGLLFALPFYFVTFDMFDAHIALQFSLTTFLSVLYLGVIATPVGFMLYYYLLSQRSATQVALVTLISPVLSLWLGHSVNNEPMTTEIIIGTTLILWALIIHNFFDSFLAVLSFRKVGK